MVIPTLRYQDAKGVIDFLERAFGFERKAVMENDDGTIGHAELIHGRGMVMIGSAGIGDPQFDTGRASIYVVVDDPDALFARATGAGAEVVMPLTDTDYGSRDFGVNDPEGNRWSFGTYAPQP